MSPDLARRGLRLLYAINAASAAAAALVLTVAPGAIPRAVGIEMTASQDLLAYLLAAAELAVASMSALAMRTHERAVDVQTVTVLVIFHAASAVGGSMAVSAGASALVLWNVLARVLIVAALVACARVVLRRSPAETTSSAGNSFSR
jgi:hypothetical protein